MRFGALIAANAVATIAAATCPPDATEFHGRCVQHDECCVESLCSPGEVFEYRDQPRCVACAEASSQAAMTFCAGQELKDREEDLHEVYEALRALEVDPAVKHRSHLKRFHDTWEAQRSVYCGLLSEPYEGGTLQSMLYARCMSAETEAQSRRLKQLWDEWIRYRGEGCSPGRSWRTAIGPRDRMDRLRRTAKAAAPSLFLAWGAFDEEQFEYLGEVGSPKPRYALVLLTLTSGRRCQAARRLLVFDHQGAFLGSYAGIVEPPKGIKDSTILFRGGSVDLGGQALPAEIVLGGERHALEAAPRRE